MGRRFLVGGDCVLLAIIFHQPNVLAFAYLQSVQLIVLIQKVRGVVGDGSVDLRRMG
jgi:hypothetical protein